MNSLANDTHHMSTLKRYLFATILPIVFLSFSLSVLIYDQVQQYTFTKSEIEGVGMMNLLYNSLTDLQEIRGYSQITQWGDHNEINENLRQLKQKFINRFHQPEWFLQANKFDLTIESDQLVKQARQLFSINPTHTEGSQLFIKYSRIITEILQLLQLTADHTNLILDPELDTYYLIDVLDRQIPYLAESVGRVRGMGSGLLSKKTITPEEKKQLNNYLVAIQTSIESIENAQSIIIKTSSKLRNTLHLLPENLNQVLTPLTKTCLLIKDENSCPTMLPEEFFQLATKTIDLLSAPYETGIHLLTAKLKERQTLHMWRGGLISFGTAVAIILMLYFNRAFYHYDQKIHQEMLELSVTDQLTGLYNRRHLYSIFPKELHRSLRQNDQLYIGLLDVDNFKKYNDTYGHPEGDIVLQHIADSMKSILQRGGDFCFRIGGEEFCFLFSGANIKKAELFVNRIKTAVESLNIEHSGNPPYNVVTVSIGLATVPADSNIALEQTMSTVDQALYKAKEKGKNRCILAA